MSNAKADRPEILFIDDSKTARAAGNKILSKQYAVDEAVNGKDAWKKLENNPDYAVVFVDLQMPEMNGLQLLKHIRTSPDRRIAQKPIIMITGHSDTHAAMRAVFE
ncbi:MAG: response regulator, partial [Gammaproteobacteria bacterium]|nr:response regulator [Gammaproteobacteria bacterium]